MFVFMGTSFSVNITNVSLRYAFADGVSIDVVTPNPFELEIPKIRYFRMSASDYVASEKPKLFDTK